MGWALSADVFGGTFGPRSAAKTVRARPARNYNVELSFQ